MNHHRSPRASLEASRVLFLWLAAAVWTLTASHVPIHLRVAKHERDLSFLLWMACFLGCLPMLCVTWLGSRVKLEHFESLAISLPQLDSELLVTSLLRSGQLCVAAYFLAYDSSSAGAFPVANSVALGLVPILVIWLTSIGRRSVYLQSTSLNQASLALMAVGFSYSATGLMHRGFFFRDATLAVVAASLVASSKVSMSLAYEHNSAANIVFCRLAAAVFVLPAYILVFGQPGAIAFWLSHFSSVAVYVLVMALALPLADYFVLRVQIATSTPCTSVVTDALAWFPSTLFAAFISKIDLYNSTFVGFLFLPFVVASHLLAILRYPYIHTAGVG